MAKTKVLLIVFILLLAHISKSQEILPLMAISNVSGAPTEMKMSALKAVLKGEQQRWKNGEKVSIALMKTNTPTGKNISSKIYNMTGNEVNKFWLALVFQGKAQAPNFFNSADEVEKFVSQNPGAIGITDQPASSSQVQTIVIDGQITF